MIVLGADLVFIVISHPSGDQSGHGPNFPAVKPGASAPDLLITTGVYGEAP